MNPVGDRRQCSAQKRRTNRIICQAFVALLEEKPLEQITIRELCVKADMNRATFYRYYLDIYDLYEYVTNEFFEELFVDTVKAHMAHGTSRESVGQEITQVLGVIEREKTLCKTLLNTASSGFARHLADQIAAISIQQNLTGDATIDDEWKTKLNFLNGGILSVIIEWLREDCRTDRKIISAVVTDGIYHVFE